MNAENFSELLNELPDEMIDAAMKKKTRLHIPYTRILMPAAAACILAAVCTGFYLMKDGKPERTLTEQSREAEITEVTDSSTQTGFDVLQTETTYTSVSGTTDTDPAGTSTSGTSASAGTQTSQTAQTAQTAKATVLPVSVRTQTDIPGTTASSEAASVQTTETTAPSVYREAFGSYTLPKPLADIIAEEIGTDAFCYFMNEPLPVAIPWQNLDIPIITQDHIYKLVCRPTDSAYEVKLYTSYDEMRISYSGTHGYELVVPADIIGGEYDKTVNIGDEGEWDGAIGFPEYTKKYREIMSEEEFRIYISRMAWFMVHKLREDTDFTLYPQIYCEDPGNNFVFLNFTPDNFAPENLDDDMDNQIVSSVQFVQNYNTQELNEQQIKEAVAWWNQIGTLSVQKCSIQDFYYDIKQDSFFYKSEKDLNITNRTLIFNFTEPFLFPLYNEDLQDHVFYQYYWDSVYKINVIERKDGAIFLDWNSEHGRTYFRVINDSLHLYQPD